MLSIRTSIREEIPYSPAQITFGVEPTLPHDLLLPYGPRDDQDVAAYTTKLRRAMHNVTGLVARPTDTRRNYIDKNLQTCSHVFVKNETKKGLDMNYLGPYKVIDRNPKYFKVLLPRGIDTVSVDRLKAAYLSEEYLKPPEPQITIPIMVGPVQNSTPSTPPPLSPRNARPPNVPPRNHNTRRRRPFDVPYNADGYVNRFGRRIIKPTRLTF